MQFEIVPKNPEVADVSAEWAVTVGEEVLAQHDRQGKHFKYYKAKIEAINTDGTFDIQYDDVNVMSGTDNIEKKHLKKLDDSSTAADTTIDVMTGTWSYVSHAGSEWNIDWTPCGSGAAGQGTFCGDAYSGPLLAEPKGGTCPIEMV